MTRFLLPIFFLLAPSISYAQHRFSCAVKPSIERSIADAVEAQIPGNESKASVTECWIDLQESKALVRIRAHVKHRSCVDRPWPLDGHWCLDEYNNWANAYVSLYVGSGCYASLADWDVTEDGGPGGVYGDIAAVGFKELRNAIIYEDTARTFPHGTNTFIPVEPSQKGLITRVVESEINTHISEQIAVNGTLRQFCGR